MERTGFDELVRLTGSGKQIRNTHINIGSGIDQTIRQLALMIGEITEFRGSIAWDDSKPDGTMRKLLDSTKINKIGWKPKISLLDGLKMDYRQYLDQKI